MQTSQSSSSRHCRKQNEQLPQQLLRIHFQIPLSLNPHFTINNILYNITLFITILNFSTFFTLNAIPYRVLSISDAPERGNILLLPPSALLAPGHPHRRVKCGPSELSIQKLFCPDSGLSAGSRHLPHLHCNTYSTGKMHDLKARH